MDRAEQMREAVARLVENEDEGTWLSVIPAAEVAVKPLEWVEIRPGQYFEARVIGILYSVRLGTDGIVRWQAGHMGTWHEAPTIEASKAAAQADYEARILSALDVTSPKETVAESKPAPTLAEALELPEVKALVEAAQDVIRVWKADGEICVNEQDLRNLSAALRRIAEGKA